MRGFFTFMAVLAAVGILAAAGMFLWGSSQLRMPGPLKQEVVITIERGQGVSSIADTLKAQGIITHPFLFKVVVRFSGRHTDLKAGEYQFEAGVAMASIITRLIEGRVVLRQFTVPEGFTSWQVVELLKKTEGLSGAVTEIPAEGSLLPETYSFTKDEPRAAKIAQMQAAMARTIDELWEKRSPEIAVKDKREAVILASIVEKETGVAYERARIAGVFENRLRKGMALQTDPTVIYALTNGRIQTGGMGPLGRRLLSKDMQIDSPYNTYKYAGLPPGPIANPGREAIAAVLNPEKNDYIYFVADGTGGHIFAATLDEHNANVAKWRKIRAQK